jgi:UDP-N-acetylmuramate: L-alanyl-gamma-D-glutamyl-meso-diaminopimelate ligase
VHVHFIAIAGTAMGSLAGLMKSRGHVVTGSDEGVYPPMSTFLERLGIPVTIGFKRENVLARRPDLVVIGNAVRPDNPEARAVLESGLAYASLPDALYAHAIRGKHSVVICGTHGKTTTTSMVAALLLEAGRDPSLLVGGIAANFDGSFRDGAGPEFVVEGDEYDTAFFDKTPKFLHYGPETAVITSIEFDHADIYRDLAHVQGEFAKLVAKLGTTGTLIAAAGAETIDAVAREARCRVVRYGIERDAELSARELAADAEGTQFDVIVRGARAARARLPAWGRHNVANALAALAVCDVRGVPVARAAPLLARYRGVKRRQEVRGEVAGISVVDDFGHHPTAVRETLGAMAARYPGRRIVAVMEPRSNTSRRAVFQQEYVRAFDGAARAVIARVPDAPIYSAFGDEPERLDADRLAADLTARGIPAAACDGVDAIVDHLASMCRPGDVVVTLSNGGFGDIWTKLLRKLAHGDASAEPSPTSEENP